MDTARNHYDRMEMFGAYIVKVKLYNDSDRKKEIQNRIYQQRRTVFLSLSVHSVKYALFRSFQLSKESFTLIFEFRLKIFSKALSL